MKTIFLVSLVCLLSLAAPAVNFFGIEYNGNTADNIMNLLYGLVQGDEEMIREYGAQLKKTDPDLAGKIDPDELKIPCANCRGRGAVENDAPCPVCGGTGHMADAQSLGYLQYKFSAALDAGKTEKAAWKAAKKAFDERRAVVLDAEMLVASVIRKDDGGLLLSCSNCDETVFLKGLDPSFPAVEGTPVNGSVWPAGTHRCLLDGDSPVDVKCYTATLWMD